MFQGGGGSPAVVKDAEIIFLGESTLRVIGDLVLYEYWDGGDHMFSMATCNPATDYPDWPTREIQRPWYSLARWFGEPTYTIYEHGWRRVGTREIDVIVAAQHVQGLPKRPRSQAISRDELMFGDG